MSDLSASRLRPGPEVGIVLAALAVAGFDLRTAVTSVSAALPQITRGLGAPALFDPVAAASPPLVFAVAGLLAPALLHRVGAARGLLAALATTAAGLLARAVSPDAAVFLVLGLPTLGGLGVANVALPAVVKEYLPHRIGLGTAVYTAMLSVGTATAAALTVPAAQAWGTGGSGWRVGLAVWAVPALVGAVLGVAVHRLPRQATAPAGTGPASTGPASTDPASTAPAGTAPAGAGPVRGGRAQSPAAGPAVRVTIAAVARTRLGWAMAVLMAGQSASSYVLLSYLPSIAADDGRDARTGGLLLSLFSVLGLSSSVLPLALGRVRDHRAVILALTACWVAGDLLTAFRPGGLWAPVALLGVGSSLFTVGLLLFPLRAGTVAGTAALSGFALSVAYVLTPVTVFAAGAVRHAAGTWTGVLVAMAVSMVAVAAAGLVVGRPGRIEDQVAVSPRRAGSSSR